MNSIFSPSKVNYSFLYFCQFNDLEKNSKELAVFVSSLADPDKYLLGFDRILWTSLSSGQMPSQLYSFNFYGSSYACELEEGVLVIFSKEEIGAFPKFVRVKPEKIYETSINIGEMTDSYEEDDEFENCFYASLLNWQQFTDDFPVVDKLQNIWFDQSIQLLIGKSIYAQDEWVENYFNDELFNGKNILKHAVHLLLPCPEKIKSLEEAVQDKERIHLDPEIKGIYC